MTHYYRIKRWGSLYFGKPCRVLVPRSKNGNILIQFEDGHTTVTTRWGVRRLPERSE